MSEATVDLRAEPAVSERRPSPPRTPLLRGDPAIQRPLLFVIAAMAFLTALALGGLLILEAESRTWASEFRSEMTVELAPNQEMPAGEQLARTLEILDDEAAVTSATTLGEADLQHLLEPWLGEAPPLDELPLPQIVSLTIDPEFPLDGAALGARLEEAVPGARLDTHERWQDALAASISAMRLLGLVICGMIAAATIAVIGFAARASLIANKETVDVLHLIGAEDSFIASELQRHYGLLGFLGGAFGVVAAGALIYALPALQGELGLYFLPVLDLEPRDYLWLALIAPAAGLIAIVTARLSVLRVLGRSL